MNRQRSSAVAVLILVAVAAGCGRSSPADETPTPADVAQQEGERRTSTDPDVNPDAALAADFERRVEAYLDIHEDAAKGRARLKETRDVEKLKQAQDTLAARIREARADAKHGDIFTPEIRGMFLRLLSPELKGEDGRDAKAVMKDDAPDAVPLRVNATYPEGAPIPTVPANLLLHLPRLPEPLEYRFIGRHLILLDTDANLIVDYAPRVLR